MNEQETRDWCNRLIKVSKLGDIQSFLNSVAGDVQWQLPEMKNVPFAGKWQGREEVGQFFSKVFELQEVFEFGPEELIAQGDKVVVLGPFSMRIKLRPEISAQTRRTFGQSRAAKLPISTNTLTQPP